MAACLAPWIGDDDKEDKMMSIIMNIIRFHSIPPVHVPPPGQTGLHNTAQGIRQQEIRGTFVPSNARQALVWFGVF